MEVLPEKVNTLEILMQISNDVSSIKTEMKSMQVSIQKDNEILNNRITHIEERQQEDSKRIGELEKAEDKKYAKRWKTVVAFIGTAIGGMVLAKIPDFIVFMIKTSKGM